MSYIMRNGVPYLLIKDGKKYMEATPIKVAEEDKIREYFMTHEGKTDIYVNENNEYFFRFTFEPFPSSIINEMKVRGKNTPQLRLAYKWGDSYTSWLLGYDSDGMPIRSEVDTWNRPSKLQGMHVIAVHEWDENNVGWTHRQGDTTYPITPSAVKLTPEDLVRGEVFIPIPTGDGNRPWMERTSGYWVNHPAMKAFIMWSPEDIWNGDEYMMESSTMVKNDSTNSGDWVTVPNSFAAGGTRRKGYTVSIKNNELLNDSERVYVSMNGAFNRDNGHREDKEELDITNSIGLISTNCYALQFRTRCGSSEKRFRIKSESMGWDFISTSAISGGNGRSTYTTKMIPIDRDVTDIEILYL